MDAIDTTTRRVHDRLSLLADAYARVRLQWQGTTAEQALVSALLAREARNMAAYLGNYSSAASWASVSREQQEIVDKLLQGPGT